jgi:hypothetical protein
MSGTGEGARAGFPAIGQYELIPGPGEPGYEDPNDIQIIDLNNETAMRDLHNALADALGEARLEEPDEEAEAEEDEAEEADIEDDDPEEASLSSPMADEDEEPIDPDDDDPYDEEGI